LAAQSAREAGAREGDRAVEARAAGLRTLYPWAIPSGGKDNDRVRAGKNLKRLLGEMFPGVTFSAKSDTFSGGDSIDIGYTLGPCSKKVQEIIDRISDGWFDGMDDSYKLNTEVEGCAWRRVMGSAKYLHANRSHGPDEFIARLACDLCAMRGVTYIGLDQVVTGWPPTGGWSNGNGSLLQYARSIIELTDLPTDNPDDYQGIRERTTKEQEENPSSSWWRIQWASPSPAAFEPSPPATEEGDATLTENAEHQGIELRFPSKPEPRIIEAMKSHKWRWNRNARCWYHKASDAELLFAQSVLKLVNFSNGGRPPQAPEVFEPDTCGSSAVEDAACMA